jgi:uncharacterized cupredoxin-like copper-binding protein
MRLHDLRRRPTERSCGGRLDVSGRLEVVLLELTLRNSGQMPHDFTLNEGVAQPVKLTVNGGETASGTFTLERPGTYSFDCSMPGHAMAGMRGTITAQ